MYNYNKIINCQYVASYLQNAKQPNSVNVTNVKTKKHCWVRIIFATVFADVHYNVTCNSLL